MSFRFSNNHIVFSTSNNSIELNPVVKNQSNNIESGVEFLVMKSTRIKVLMNLSSRLFYEIGNYLANH